jgi:hypothetical protein
VLVEAGVLPDLATDLEELRSVHYGKYRLLHRVRLHHLWVGLHVMIAAYGVLLVALTLIQ